MNEKFTFTGKDNLELMKLAVNYNTCIFNFLKKDLPNDINILDFGAGGGEFSNRFYKEFKDKSNIFALEIDEELRKKILCPSYENLSDIKDNSMDFIYSSNVLEHIEDDSAIVRELRKKLKENAFIKILVPAKQVLYSKMDELVGHHRRYEREELYNLFLNSGFKVKYCKYFDFAGFFLAYLYKLLNKNSNNKGDIDKKSLLIYDRYIFPLSRFFDKISFGNLIGKNLILLAYKS